MKLFVDDSREFPKWGYECCRNAASAKILLSSMKFDYISLDYSLGTNCENGLDILVWMKENKIDVPAINIHSNHSIGMQRMKDYCQENFPDSEITMRTLQK